MSALAVRAGLASRPEGAGWGSLAGVAALCGIGFTMSLFVASLAFDESAAYSGLERLGILIGSLVSGVTGYFGLRLALTRRAVSAARSNGGRDC